MVNEFSKNGMELYSCFIAILLNAKPTMQLADAFINVLVLLLHKLHL
jgi:hypothetical protein